MPCLKSYDGRVYAHLLKGKSNSMSSKFITTIIVVKDRNEYWVCSKWLKTLINIYQYLLQGVRNYKCGKCRQDEVKAIFADFP